MPISRSPKVIQAGQFRDGLKFYEDRKVSDGQGGFVTTPTLFNEALGSVEPLSVERSLRLAQYSYQVSHQVITYWHDTYTAGQRIIWNRSAGPDKPVVLTIKGLENWQNRSRFAVIECYEDPKRQDLGK